MFIIGVYENDFSNLPELMYKLDVNDTQELNEKIMEIFLNYPYCNIVIKRGE